MNSSTKDLAEKQAKLCKIFGNASRILILWILDAGELPVSEIAFQVGTSVQNTSQHLALLKRYGIVTARRDAQTIYYRITESDSLRDCPVLMKAPSVL
ncbi:MAG: winged helix-turn-helix transcriptional regulator [Anaerolineae bacterium]|jgi:ArsR family transcriptional regulator, virulence genes transcriptional regulator|nr:winged helix-turn-helix transcriptional regulator [Anaerolineae bacterium]